MSTVNDILLRPVITEKMTGQGEKFGRFGFIVAKDANKLQIKEAVEARYGVTVTGVRTMVCPGKDRTRYTRAAILKGRTSSYKKAVVSLKEGDVIDLYSSI